MTRYNKGDVVLVSFPFRKRKRARGLACDIAISLWSHPCRRYRKRPQKRYFGTGQRQDKDGPLP